MAQTFTVTGADDNVADGNQSYTIVTAASSADARYAMINPADVSVTNVDNDSAGFTVTPTMGLTTGEDGSQATFTVVLRSRPTGTNSVTVNLTSSNEAEGIVSPAMFTFTNANWNVAQTFTVTGQDDSIIDGPQSYSISITSTSGDPAYNAFPNIPSVSLTNADNDSAGIKITPTMCTTTPTMSDTLKVTLNTQPMGNVTLVLHSDKPTEADVSSPLGGAVVLNPSNWNTGVTVTVAGLMTMAPAGTMVPYKIITEPATSNDSKYDGFNAPDVVCTNTQ
jgi:hypothetical protein